MKSIRVQVDEMEDGKIVGSLFYSLVDVKYEQLRQNTITGILLRALDKLGCDRKRESSTSAR